MTRTTITIDEDLLTDVKTEAARTGRTVSDVLADAFRQMISRHATDEPRRPVRLPVFPVDTAASGGLLPGVDLDNNAALRDYFDEAGEKSWP
jgi:hypothetical protein